MPPNECKVIGFPVPPALAEEVEQVSKAERRTKSELLREMFRVYQRSHQQREQEEERWVVELICEAKEEQERNPMTTEELAKELKELARDVSQQAKNRGITSKDVNRIVDESRKRWRTS